MRKRRIAVVLCKRGQPHLKFNERILIVQGLCHAKVLLRILISFHIAQDDAAVDESRRILAVDRNRLAEFAVGGIEVVPLIAGNAPLNCGEIRRLAGGFSLSFRNFLRHLVRIRPCRIARSGSVGYRFLFTAFLAHRLRSLLLLAHFFRLCF